MPKPQSSTDTELLVGIAVVALVVAAMLYSLVLLCRRAAGKTAKTMTITHPATAPRYVLVSETQAFTARRYKLDGTADYHVSTICYKCGLNPATTILTDCGHGGLCPSCSHDVWKTKRECPVCNRPLHAVLHIVAHNANTARVEQLIQV